MVRFSVPLWNVNTDYVFASVGGMESRASLSDTIGEETSGRAGKSTLGTARAWAYRDIPGFLAGHSQTPYISGFWEWGLLFLIHVPDAGGMLKEPSSYLATTHK